ncbi:MAG: endopeptidase La, partial [Alphaproteobacteria bacterium]|nr:endopeptidase La [Alphaproteobacteria bacterium]
SDVMFITTANSLRMPQPLLDRMEIIRIAGYTEDEKIEIARRHLIPKQVAQHGLQDGEFVLEDKAVRDLIRYYTREAGVRNLEREIANLARKAVKEILLAFPKSRKKPAVKTAALKVKATDDAARKIKAKKPEKITLPITVSDANLEKYAGIRKFHYGEAEITDMVGVVTGLAWTETGGELLTIESVTLPGKGRVHATGKLGDVMKESVQAAESFVKSRSHLFGVRTSHYEKRDIHVHVPEGATPKDGPSAGVGMVTSIVSVLTGIPVRRDVAMTGEITLRGRVLPIGGLKEKLLAALRGGIKTVIIPSENLKDLADIPDTVKTALKIVPVSQVEEVLTIALVEKPNPIDAKEAVDFTEKLADTPPVTEAGTVDHPIITH